MRQRRDVPAPHRTIVARAEHLRRRGLFLGRVHSNVKHAGQMAFQHPEGDARLRVPHPEGPIALPVTRRDRVSGPALSAASG